MADIFINYFGINQIVIDQISPLFIKFMNHMIIITCSPKIQLTAQEKAEELKQEKKSQFPWANDDQIFNKWKMYPGYGCCLQLANIKSTNIRENYWIPCGKPNVMGTKIPAGSRAGARPCGATWAAFGGIYTQGTTQRAYCTKCWYAYCLNKEINFDAVHKSLQRYQKLKKQKNDS